MKKQLGVRLAMAGLVAFGMVGAVSSEANACGGEWVPAVEIDHRPEGIARAEKLMEKGDNVAAAATVIRVMPHIKQLKAKSALVERAQRLLAVATARGNGSLAITREVPDYAQGKWVGRTAQEKQANLDWSIATLRTLSENSKDDTGIQTDLAEALAHVDGHKAEAKEILEKLAQKDLIASPEGYATLAELRSQAGDAEGQKLAQKRCESMAKTANTCRVSA
jgi:hypothetical protein